MGWIQHRVSETTLGNLSKLLNVRRMYILKMDVNWCLETLLLWTLLLMGDHWGQHKNPTAIWILSWEHAVANSFVVLLLV